MSLRVLLLGGSGRFADSAARCLAESDVVADVTLAGRTESTLRRRVSGIGEKADAVTVDILDERRLAGLAADYDIVVNAAGPEWEVLLPALRASIQAGVHYCDLGADARTTEKQLELDAQAKDAGVTAVVGMGFDPGIDNLLAMEARKQFDRVEQITVCYHLALPDDLLREAVDEVRKRGRIDPSWQMVMGILAGPVRAFRDRSWVMVRPREHATKTVSPTGSTALAYPVATPEQITLPRYIPEVRDVSCVCSITPPTLSELIYRNVREIEQGTSTVRDATRTFLHEVGSHPGRWLKGSASGWDMWLVVTGVKDGRRRRYTCWPVRADGTGIPLAVAARKILRSEVAVRGVLPPEACFEPMPFLEEVGSFMPAEDREKPLYDESAQWL